MNSSKEKNSEEKKIMQGKRIRKIYVLFHIQNKDKIYDLYTLIHAHTEIYTQSHEEN